MKLAASCLKELGAKTVVVKGGNRLDGNKALDVLYNGKEYKIFEKPVLDKIIQGRMYICFQHSQ